MSDLRYVVLNEHTLGYVTTNDPLSLQVLHGLSVKGGHDWRNDPVCITPDDVLRPATRPDFCEHQVALPPRFTG